MPHYTTWGGTYVTRPVAIEDRDYSDNDYDINDFVIESTQADVLTGNIGGNSGPGGTTFLTENVGSTSGPGGSTFRSEEDDNIVVIHPNFRPVDDVDGVSDQVAQFTTGVGGAKLACEDCSAGSVIDNNTFEVNRNLLNSLAVDGVSDQCPQLRGEVEWTYIGDSLSGTPDPGGSTFTTGYAEAVGLDSFTVDVMNNVAGSASPGGDDI